MICGFTPKVFRVHIQYLFPINVNLQTLQFREAAIIAACNSSAKENTKVPVDYTLVKNVKKPSGALPGKVVYYTNNMIYVIADKTKITRKKVRLSRTFSFMLFFSPLSDDRISFCLNSNDIHHTAANATRVYIILLITAS